MVATPGVTYRMFKALAKKKINIALCENAMWKDKKAQTLLGLSTH